MFLPALAVMLLATARSVSAVGCATHTYGTCEDNIVHWYDPDDGMICDPLDCGGGRAPPKTNNPCCAAYTGTDACVQTTSYLSCFKAAPTFTSAAPPPADTPVNAPVDSPDNTAASPATTANTPNINATPLQTTTLASSTATTTVFAVATVTNSIGAVITSPITSTTSHSSTLSGTTRTSSSSNGGGSTSSRSSSAQASTTPNAAATYIQRDTPIVVMGMMLGVVAMLS